MPEAFVTIDRRPLQTWSSITVERALDASTATFEIEVGGGPGGLLPGARALVQVQGENLIVGFVDQVEVEGGSDGISTSARGRERTADLLDGSPVGVAAEWYGATLAQIAHALAFPVGIQVDDRTGELPTSEGVPAPAEPFPHFAAQPGDSAWTTIERAARLRGVLIATSRDGHLVLHGPGRERSEGYVGIGPGGNALEWGWSVDHSTRYRTWVVKGQDLGLGEALGASFPPPEGRAEDLEVRGQRSTVILAQGQVTDEDCEALARWNATVAAARADVLTVTMRGWRQAPDGPLWTPGILVPVEGLGVSGDRLVTRVTLQAGSGGERAKLSLARPDAFALDPQIASPEAAFSALEGLS